MIILTENKLGDKGVIMLGEAMMTNTTLALLNLNRAEQQTIEDKTDTENNFFRTENGIRDEGARKFGQQLEGNTTLTSLSLEGNTNKL